MKPLIAFAISIPLLPAAETLKIEHFDTQSNNDSWFLYRFDKAAEGVAAFSTPEWNTIAPGTSTDASTTFAVADGVGFVAVSSSSGNTFTGDYQAAGVASLNCQIYVSDVSAINRVEIAILSGGQFYFSGSITSSENGWSEVNYHFTKQDWFILSGGALVKAAIPESAFMDISQIGINFFPNSATAIGSRVGIDSVALLPELTPPAMRVSVDPGAASGTVRFIRSSGFLYQIESQMALNPEGWGILADAGNLTGTGPVEIPFTAPPKQFYRLTSRPILTPVAISPLRR